MAIAVLQTVVMAASRHPPVMPLTGRFWRFFVPVLCWAISLAPAGHAAAGVIGRISVAADGGQANAGSTATAMSADGLRIVFVSQADNLVAGDTNNAADVFLRDRVTGTTTRVSVAADGGQADGSSTLATISANGRFVLFASSATNLTTAAPVPFRSGLYLRDLQANTTVPAAVLADGSVAPPTDVLMAVSNDGRYVGFTSDGRIADRDTDNDGRCDTNCDVNTYTDALVFDRQAGTYVRASVATNGQQADFHCRFEDMTPDGRLVVFSSEADNLVANDTNNARDVFLRDLAAGTTILVSRTPAGRPGNGASGSAAISADGRFIAFSSDADDLVAGDTNGRTDVFVFDRRTGRVFRVSLAQDGSEAANGISYAPDISADGRFISFVSNADNLAPLDPTVSRRAQVYVHDRITGLTTRASESAAGSPGDFSSGVPSYPPVPPAISANGQVVVFYSMADNLVPNDTNGQPDIFIGANSRIDLVQAVAARLRPDDGQPGFALVAGKDLVVRVRAVIEPDAGPVPVQGTLCVDHPVASCPPGNRFTAAGTLYPGGRVFTDAERRQAADTVDFSVTGAAANTLLTPGNHTFAVRIEAAGSGTLPAGAITGQVAGNFRESQPLEIFIYPVQLTDSNNNRVLPRAAMLPRAADFIRSAYPVDEEKVANTVRPALPFAGLPIAQTGNAGTDAGTLAAAHLQLTRAVARRFLLDRLLLRPLAQLGKAPAANTFAAGVVANLVNGSNAIGTPGDTGLMGFTYPSIKGVVITLDREAKSASPAPLIGSTIAHEMGHQLGLGDEYCFDGDDDDTLETPCRVDKNIYLAANPPPQSREEGNEVGAYVLETMGAFDTRAFVAGRRAVFGPPGTPILSFMGAGNDTNTWVTQTEYEFLYPRLTTAPPLAAKPRTIVALTGVLGADDTVELDPPVITSSAAPLAPAPASGEYSVDFLDGSGGIIASRPLDIDFSLEYLGESGSGRRPTDAVPLAVAAELPAGTATIAISHNGTILGQVVRSANPPGVRIRGIRVTPDTVTVTWSASDPDPDPLTFSVFLVSGDGGIRYPLAYDLTATSFAFARSALATMPPGSLVEVQANDGFHTASDQRRLTSIPGDLDGDGTVGLADGVLGLRLLAGLDTPAGGPPPALADTNGNGVLDSGEVAWILRHTAGAGRAGVGSR